MQVLTCRPSPVEPVVTRLVVGVGALGRVTELLPPEHRVLVVADGVFAGSGLLARAAWAEAGAIDVDVDFIEGGEDAKRIETVARIWDRWLARGAGRDSVVIALGGGVVSDVAGFAAATFLRGIPWIAAPTTVLGMADAAIGGKTGINVSAGKNLAGAVHHPLAVVADLDALASLPVAAYADGWAEVVKAGIIGDESLFAACESSASMTGVRSRDAAVVESLLVAAMRVKVAVVEADSQERSRREILNFGHTVAHALERALPGLSHGRAVAVGMAAEAELAERRGLLPAGTGDRILAACAGLGLDAAMSSGLNEAAFVAALGVDKKRRAGRLRVALPARLGRHSDEPSVAIDSAEVVQTVRRFF